MERVNLHEHWEVTHLNISCVQYDLVQNEEIKFHRKLPSGKVLKLKQFKLVKVVRSSKRHFTEGTPPVFREYALSSFGSGTKSCHRIFTSCHPLDNCAMLRGPAVTWLTMQPRDVSCPSAPGDERWHFATYKLSPGGKCLVAFGVRTSPHNDWLV